jgi:3-phytase
MGFRQFATAALAVVSLSVYPGVADAVDVDLPVSALTSEVESDWTSVYYSKKQPLLLGNDGSPTGGWLAWKLDSASPLTQVHAETPGRRTKLVTTVYADADDSDEEDLIVSIGQPDSVIRVWEADDFEEVKSARFVALGDWSALCSWKTATGSDYLYLFGKKQAKMFLIRRAHGDDDDDDVKIIEVCL